MTSENKLQSLQGLRGVSIILVLIFHLYPKEFVNGFVGVDMFFVLSGYLMTKILSRKFTISSVVNFYKKRFSRILPLYYFTIFGTILGVLCLVLKAERREFLLDIKWCLSLVSNFQPIYEHHSYWDQISTIRFLTHLWSLSTELQYYMIVPAIHYIASNLPFYNRIFGYSLAIFFLFSFQLFMPFELSYSFLPARIWQFLLGSVAFELSRGGHEADKTKKKENNLDSFSYLLIGILGTVVSLPWLFGEHSTRLIMSVMAAVLCFFGGRLENSLFTFQPLVFIGDISYVTYLIHWPIINFVRYVQLKDDSILSIYEALVTIIIIFVLSILVLYCLEKPILQSNFSTNCVITVVFIGSCVSFIPWIRNQECLAMKTLPLSVRGKLEFNSNFSNIMSPISELGCEYNETTAGLVINIESVEYCSRKGNGTGRILVIGNSVSIRAFPQIFHIFNGNYEEIRLFAKHGGAPLLNVFPYYTQAAVDMAREMNPDLIWIIQGINEVLSRDPNSPISTDEVVQNTMDQFKGLAKMVYVDLPYFITDKIPVNLIPRIFLYRKSLKEHLSVSLSEVEEQIKGHTDRLLNLNCRNCYFNDVQKALTNGENRFYFYDKETHRPLIYDGIHLGFAAFERINPIYEKRIDQFYKVLKSERNN